MAVFYFSSVFIVFSNFWDTLGLKSGKISKYPEPRCDAQIPRRGISRITTGCSRREFPVGAGWKGYTSSTLCTNPEELKGNFENFPQPICLFTFILGTCCFFSLSGSHGPPLSRLPEVIGISPLRGHHDVEGSQLLKNYVKNIKTSGTQM